MGSNNKRKTTEQFKEEVYSIVQDEYLINGEYVNAKTKINFLHNIKECMHNFDMQPTNFLNGQRCPECMKKKRLKYVCGMKKTQEQFEKEIANLVGDEYVVESEYTGAHNKVIFRHKLCNNTFLMTPAHFYSGQRCTNKECLHNRWSNACMDDKYFNDFFKDYSDSYEMLSKYNGYKNNIIFKHKECGHIFERTPNNFVVLGDRCPKCTSVIYKGENKIELFLIEKNINFEPQKTYKDLLGINDGLLSYDFYLHEYNLLIEYQGEQHEYPIEHFGGEEKFKIQQEHDSRKREYAKLHNIDLLEIWYRDFENIENILENYLNLYNKKVV